MLDGITEILYSDIWQFQGKIEELELENESLKEQINTLDCMIDDLKEKIRWLESKIEGPESW